jgi:hypothetical protein
MSYSKSILALENVNTTPIITIFCDDRLSITAGAFSFQSKWEWRNDLAPTHPNYKWYTTYISIKDFPDKENIKFPADWPPNRSIHMEFEKDNLHHTLYVFAQYAPEYTYQNRNTLIVQNKTTGKNIFFKECTIHDTFGAIDKKAFDFIKPKLTVPHL